MNQPRDPKHDELMRRFIESRLNRRSLLKKTAGVAAGAALAVTPFTNFKPESVAAAKKVLQEGGNSADAAVAAAQQYKGAEITIISESGLQAEDPKVYAGPMWEELTGIKVTTIEKPFDEIFPTMVQEHVAGTGGIDVLQIVPLWMADCVNQGMVEPLQPFIDQYMNVADLDDIHPTYRDLMNYGGQVYGLFDDGDTLIGYYRADLFEDPANMEEYKTKTGKDLGPPATWEDYDSIQAFFTEKGAGQYWGGASQRQASQSNHWFSQEFRVRGGKFFDPETMTPTLDSQAGIDTITRMLASNETMPEGVETWDFVQTMTAWLQGQLAMVGCTWPPYGRFSEDYGKGTKQMEWVPPSTISGKVKYFVMPGGYSQMASGFLLSVSSASKNKEAAYLFSQWANSPSVSLQRCLLPYSLRDPYRISHYESEEYRSKWPNAGLYLDTLRASADKCLLDLIMPGAHDFEVAMDQIWGAAQGGTAPDQALKDGNSAFSDIVERGGMDAMKAAYAEYIKLKGAYPV
jgi:multiple sugar transport system substrate-binding protein